MNGCKNIPAAVERVCRVLRVPAAWDRHFDCRMQNLNPEMGALTMLTFKFPVFSQRCMHALRKMDNNTSQSALLFSVSGLAPSRAIGGGIGAM